MTSADVLQIKTELLEAVTEAMTELLRTGDPRAASGRVLRAALQQTDSQYGFAGVTEGQTLRILNHEGVTWHNQVNREFYEQALQRYQRVGYLEFTNFNNLFGQVLTTGRVVISNQPSRDPRAGGLPPGHPPLNTFLGVPILNGDQILGLIGVANRVNGYGDAEQHRLEVLAQMTGVIYDAYARQQREAALAQQLRQVHKMEAIGQLAGGVAHDFNNLLTAMSGFTELVLLTFDETDSRRGDLLEVRKAAERAATLTRQLLAFGRRQMLLPQVLDVNALVASIETLLRRTIREDIELVMALQFVDPVRVDASQLEQVLLNLALNAQDAMPKGGQLRFVTETVEVDEAWARRYPPMTPGRYVHLTVSDTGVGMTPETQARIFEPFFTTKPPGKGTGLGLATVYGIVKQSGGFIWIDSHVGQGTSFAIYFPVVDAAVEPMVRVVTTGPVSGGSETILLAEDDGAVRRLAKHTLSYHGYTVLEGRDGDDALALARQQSAVIHLLITDVVMPGLSGPDLAAHLRKERPAMRVLYTSGYADNITARAGVEHGVPVLGKPFLPMDLLRKVRETLDAKSPSSV